MNPTCHHHAILADYITTRHPKPLQEPPGLEMRPLIRAQFCTEEFRDPAVHLLDPGTRLPGDVVHDQQIPDPTHETQ